MHSGHFFARIGQRTWYPRFCFVLAIVALASGGFGLGYSGVRLWHATGPRLRLAGTTAELGNVAYGDACSAVFDLVNDGGSDLHVRLAKVSCTCTVPEFDSSPIKPGQTRALRLHTVAPFREGEFGTDIVMETDDTRMRKVGLAIRGNAVSFVDAVPGFVSFGKVGYGELPAERTIRIGKGQLADNTTLAGARVIGVDKSMQARVSVFAVDSAMLTVKLLPGTPSGFYRRELSVSFASPKPYTLQVPVMAEIVGTLRAQPQSLFFGTLEKRQTIERTFAISGALADDSVTIRPLSSQLLDCVTVGVGEMIDGMRTVRVKISNPAGSARIVLDGDIVVDVFSGPNAAAQSLAVPVLGVLAD